MFTKRNIVILITVIIFLTLLLIPESSFGIEGLTVAEKRVIAIFVAATILWVFEPIPVHATSVGIIVAELILLSDKMPHIFKGGEDFGKVLSYKEIMGNFANPLILLFLGGFFLAMAATKYRLDVNLARVILKPFGKKPFFIMFGLMVTTAIFSMFMSNTATTAMMLAILTPVLAGFEGNDKGKIAFSLAIPFAANIGGIGTPIGTPPNAIAMKYLTGDDAIGFGEWMGFAVPYVAVLLIFAWFMIWFLFPSKQKTMELKIKGKFLKNWKAITVYATFGITILLWLTGKFHGMNSYVVAMIPIAIFSLTSIITKEDLKKISWDVLWLVAGGFALGMGMDKTGLSHNFVHSIPFDTLSPILLVVVISFLTLMMSTFISNTVAVNLLLPIVAAVGAAFAGLEGYGGSKMLILVSTMSASLAMMLPVSTPPNAIAYSSGYIKTPDMIKAGGIIGVVGILLVYLTMFILKNFGFFG